jgi:hypothetical protein
MLLAALGSSPELHARNAQREEADWWSRFVREMEAIGCVNIRQAENGEWEFDCPAHAVSKAKALVAKYRARE